MKAPLAAVAPLDAPPARSVVAEAVNAVATAVDDGKYAPPVAVDPPPPPPISELIAAMIVVST